MNYWRVFCDEKEWPGLWRFWLETECVAVGWPPPDFKYRFDDSGKGDRSWSTVRNYLRTIEPGDQIVAHLEGSRVGRIGEVVRKCVSDDEWDPLVPRSGVFPEGEQGRRIFVRWNSECGPKIPWWVSKLPPGKRFPAGPTRAALSRIDAATFKEMQAEASNPLNNVALPSHESPAKEYIAALLGADPTLIGEGLRRWPSTKVAERVLGKGSRANILLMEKNGAPVVVECIDRIPEADDVRRVHRCLELARKETSIKARGILVHDGVAQLRPETVRELKKGPAVELASCSMSIDFRHSGESTAIVRE